MIPPGPSLLPIARCTVTGFSQTAALAVTCGPIHFKSCDRSKRYTQQICCCCCCLNELDARGRGKENHAPALCGKLAVFGRNQSLLRSERPSNRASSQRREYCCTASRRGPPSRERGPRLGGRKSTSKRGPPPPSGCCCTLHALLWKWREKSSVHFVRDHVCIGKYQESHTE